MRNVLLKLLLLLIWERIDHLSLSWCGTAVGWGGEGLDRMDRADGNVGGVRVARLFHLGVLITDSGL